MATIVKAPSTGGARGVVVFTTPERDRVLNARPQVRAALEAVKDRWVVGLHHNWHDWDFRYDALFDFSMAGEGDLVEADGLEVPLLELDACNFVPEDFRPGGEPFWDVLYVARAVFFKGLPEFLKSIRELYDAGDRYRVLAIVPMPPYARSDKDTVFYELRSVYDEMFSYEEQERFNLLTIDYRYPFPFDLPTLAHFYRSSRVFVHFGPDERRCRVAGYAWASARAVVAMDAVGSLLPADLRRPPFFYEAATYADFAPRIREAVQAVPRPDEFEPVRAHFAVQSTREALLRELVRLQPETDALDAPPEHLALEGLDIRLGRHHEVGAQGPNNVDMPLAEFIELLGDGEAVRAAVAAAPDPELELARGRASLDQAPAGNADRGLLGRIARLGQ